MSPRYLEAVGLFNARGGIGIYPTAFYCKDDAFQELAHQRMLEACKEK